MKHCSFKHFSIKGIKGKRNILRHKRYINYKLLQTLQYQGKPKYIATQTIY